MEGTSENGNNDDSLSPCHTRPPSLLSYHSQNHSYSNLDAEKRTRSGTIASFQIPKNLTYEDNRGTTYTEVFFDILFVVWIQSLEGRLVRSQQSSFQSALLLYCLYFIAGWFLWAAEVYLNNLYNVSDVLSLALSYAQMFGILLFLSVGSYADDDITGLAVFGLGFFIVHSITVLKWMRIFIYEHEKRHRKFIRALIIGFTIGCLFWLLASVLPDVSSTVRYALAISGTVVSVGAPMSVMRILVPPSEPHLIERFSSFTVLVLGGCLFSGGQVCVDAAVSHGMTSDPSSWVWQLFLCSACLILIPFSFVLIFEYQNGPNLVGIEYYFIVKLKGYCWFYSHLPISCSAILMMACVQKLNFITGDLDWNWKLTFCVATAILQLSLAVNHVVGVCQNKHRMLVRVIGAIIIALIPLVLGDLLAVWYLLIISCCLLLQVGLDHITYIGRDGVVIFSLLDLVKKYGPPDEEPVSCSDCSIQTSEKSNRTTGNDIDAALDWLTNNSSGNLQQSMLTEQGQEQIRHQSSIVHEIRLDRPVVRERRTLSGLKISL